MANNFFCGKTRVKTLVYTIPYELLKVVDRLYVNIPVVIE